MKEQTTNQVTATTYFKHQDRVDTLVGILLMVITATKAGVITKKIANLIE